MRQDREHPLYYLDAETLLVAIYVWVDDELKALQAQGFKLPRKQRHQKATLAELLTLGSCQEVCVSVCVRGAYRS
jgi:uncharacterized protein (DUF2132 family)